MHPDIINNPQFDVVSPGRVNLLGEHVDYNDGIVLPAAIDRNIHLQARLLDKPVLSLNPLDLNSQVMVSLENLDRKTDLNDQALPAWALYPAGVAWAAIKHGLPVNGIEAVYTSNVPIGSGLSSSAAVEVAFAVLWQAANEWDLDRLSLAKLCQQAENDYVGVNCGLMDQFACACGVKDHALFFDTRSLEYQAIPLPAGSVIVIADSGMRRSLAASAYNDRRSACEEAVRRLQVYLKDIHSLRDVRPAEFAQYANELPETIRIRAQHVIEEIARVEEALNCLEIGDSDSFGRLMLASHASLRDLYQVSITELDLLVEIAKNLPGCWGARLTGAGFGGCTVNLVEESQAHRFIHELGVEYTRRSGKTARVYLCRASQGAIVKKLY
jgi:galactokinase